VTDLRISEQPDPAIMEAIGRRLRGLRDATGLNQSQAAEQAGLDRTTVSRAERGDNPTLLTLIRLLRVYGRIDGLETFIPVAEVSPMEIVRRQRRARGRGRAGAADPERHG